MNEPDTDRTPPTASDSVTGIVGPPDAFGDVGEAALGHGAVHFTGERGEADDAPGMDDEIYIGVRLWFAKTSFRLARWVVVPCFMATTGSTWWQLPPVFGPAWPTVYRRFARWSREHVRARLHRVVLDELGARG
ncbi:hypothetical protein M877_01365 [Streptomyces niveus NCIMB 11891]|nr:hypothetical protein M877_01365 [Streptomyces niveus NCIMB 11891]